MLKQVELENGVKEPVKHRVYMRDWYFNAGIVGFLEIVLTKEEKNNIISNNDEATFSLRDGRILIEDNYIEFNASILGDYGNFAHRMFQKAFDNYDKHRAYIEKLNEIKGLAKEYLESDFESDKEAKVKREIIIKKWTYKGAYSPLENKYNDYFNKKSSFKLDKSIGEKSFSIALLKNMILEIDNYLNVLTDKVNFQYFFEKDVVQYFSSRFADDKAGIKKQSGFLNVSTKGSKESDFYTKVVEPIFTNTVKYRKKSKSILDHDKYAKNTKYDSGLISFIGNSAKNYLWIESEYFIDEISELLSWCSFAGFTDISKGKKFRFLFANQDSSVIDLFRANQSLRSEFIDQKREDHPYVRYLKNLIEAETKISAQALLNTTIIDIDNTSGFYVRIHTLNISKEKINFLIDKRVELNRLSKTSYFDLINVYQNLGEVSLNKILKNNLNYNDLNILIRLHLNNNKNSYLRSKLQVLNTLITDYKETFYGGFKMDGKLSSVYLHGKYLAMTIKSRNDENKIRGYVAKFLNYMKSQDIGDFMNLFMRIHMAYGVSTPYEIKNIFENKNTFEAIGYSFINGLLNINNKEENNDDKSLNKKEN